ncbi:MAG TPA: hypothetical protein VGX92_12595 [Pyrinomonadaceae bacterium]|jgi:hypothetical protein|nr:hypothetical protein [Pyrinomonadaceae bacterium]
MNLKRKIAIITVLIGGLLLLLILICVWAYNSIFAPYFNGRELPPELREARVITGADFLSRSEFYRANKGGRWRDLLDPNKLKSRLDSIADVSVGQLDGRPGVDIGLAGRFGLTLLDGQGKVKERITYQFEKGSIALGPVKLEREKNSFSQLRVVDIEGDGVCEILGYDGIDGAAIFNHQGRVLLSRGAYDEGSSSIYEVTAGDLDGDGVLEFIASWGYEPWTGMELFDRFGNSKWRLEEEYKPGECEVVDVDGDDRAEIVEESSGKLKIRDAQGKVLREVQMPVYLWHLSLCSRPDGSGPPQNLAVREGSLWLIDLDGKNFSQFAAPLSEIKLEKPRRIIEPGIPASSEDYKEQVFRAEGVWVRLKKDQPKYLAVIASFAALDRSLLYVYDEQGKLVYHEILPEDCDAIAKLPSENDSREDILVSGKKTVWRYAAR